MCAARVDALAALDLETIQREKSPRVLAAMTNH